MIGCLIGEVFALEAPTVLLNVNGVGYEVDTPLSTFCQLQKGQSVTLWTHLTVREDAQLLYGFLQPQEKTIFRTLLKVNGVGPKMALGILSTLSIELLIHTVENEDLNDQRRVLKKRHIAPAQRQYQPVAPAKEDAHDQAGGDPGPLAPRRQIDIPGQVDGEQPAADEHHGDHDRDQRLFGVLAHRPSLRLQARA